MVADYPRGKHQAGVILARNLRNITAARRLTRGSDFPRPARLKPRLFSLLRPLPAAMMAPSTGTAHNSNPMPSATANDVPWSPPTGRHLGAGHPDRYRGYGNRGGERKRCSGDQFYEGDRPVPARRRPAGARVRSLSTWVDVMDMSAPRISFPIDVRFAGDAGTYSTGLRRRL